MRLIILLCFFISNFIQEGISNEGTNSLVDCYFQEANIRYPAHTFTVDGRFVERADTIEQWHNAQAEKVHEFSRNTFGKLQGRNWAIASIATVYQKGEGSFALSDIYTIPHMFGSGISVKTPEPGNEEQHKKKEIFDLILTDFSLFFSDTGRHVSDFIHEIEPFIMPYFPIFVTEHRTAEKIHSAFSAWNGGVGDKNLCRNWFTDSEQVILSYVRSHINSIFSAHLNPSINGKPLFIILNIVTLQDMCGICFRSVYIQSKMKLVVEGFELPLMPFVTGVLPYHESRSEITLSATPINLPSALHKGIMVIRNK